jgi:hypothetical protein
VGANLRGHDKKKRKDLSKELLDLKNQRKFPISPKPSVIKENHGPKRSSTFI